MASTRAQAGTLGKRQALASCAAGAQGRLDDRGSNQMRKRGFRMRGLQRTHAVGVHQGGPNDQSYGSRGLGLVDALTVTTTGLAAVRSVFGVHRFCSRGSDV